jgi:hypothetical protein
MLWSSSGASTSSSTQIGAGLVRNTAKISASAVSACSPPESSDSVASTRENDQASGILMVQELFCKSAGLL